MASHYGGPGLVVALCPDTRVFSKLTSALPACDLDLDAVSLGVCDASLATYKAKVCGSVVERLCLLPTDAFGVPDAGGFGDEPLLHACYDCLSSIPSGAPAQGAWRTNALDVVRQGLRDGGLIFVVASKSLEEQRLWARALLQSGCAFVQVHNGSSPCPRAGDQSGHSHPLR